MASKRRFETGTCPWDKDFVDFTEAYGSEYQTLSVGDDRGKIRIQVGGSGSGGGYDLSLLDDEAKALVKELNRRIRKVRRERK